MGLLGIEDLQAVSSFFKGEKGEKRGRKLMHMLSVDKLNDLYDRHAHHQGQAFAADCLTDLGVDYTVEIGDKVYNAAEAKEALKTILPEGPFITISNHPYGSIDGVMLIDLFASIRPDFKVVVNQILSRIKALGPNFIEVTPNGNTKAEPTATSIKGMKDSLAQLRNGSPLGLFPAGAVSNLYPFKGKIEDRPWQEPIIKLIKKARVPVIPVRFFDGNSKWYYSLGLVGSPVRLLRLPGEVFNKAGKQARIGIGPVISVEEQKAVKDMKELTALYRKAVYGQVSIQKKLK